ncbi:MAG: ankyrin repeat domain-containing protein [Pseudohongiellaceae bacterium]
MIIGFEQKTENIKAMKLRCSIYNILISLFLTWPSAVMAQTPLIEATKNQNADEVERLLAQGVNINEPQGDGATALHWAIYRNDERITGLLLGQGANPNTSDDHGVSPLSLAALNANPLLVDLLIDKGADVNAARSSGETSLMIASHVGNTAVMELLLSAGANPNATENNKRHTALMMAVAERHLDAARLLIDRGALVSARSQNNYTPLLFAAQQGNIGLGKLLLNKGADANESAPDGISGNTNARWALIPETNASALMVAIDSGHEEMAIFLLENGADPDLYGAGRTALHSAVQHQMHALANALLESGANPDAKLARNMPVFSRVILIDNGLSVDKLGATPFFLAAGYNDLEMMDLLIEGGADPFINSNDGTTPLMVAAGADFVEGQDKYNRRWFDDNIVALQEAALPAVKKCLELGIEINAKNQRNQTALHGAVYLAGEELLSYLVTQGADINAINNRGQTPWLIASQGEYRAGSLQTLPHIADHLETLGANTTLGEDLGRYWERDARERTEQEAQTR